MMRATGGSIMINIDLTQDYTYDLFMASNANEVRELVKNGANVNFVNKFGYSPIAVASNKEVAEALLVAGADIHCQNEKGETPIFFVNDIAMIRFLVSKGAKINHRDINGETILFKSNRLLDVVKLVNLGCNPFIKNKDGAFHYENMSMEDRKAYSAFIKAFKENMIQKNEKKLELTH